jgi:hypothetical protein
MCLPASATTTSNNNRKTPNTSTNKRKRKKQLGPTMVNLHKLQGIPTPPGTHIVLASLCRRLSQQQDGYFLGVILSSKVKEEFIRSTQHKHSG